jgi:hypothetical protein
MANINQKIELTNYQQWELERYGNVLPDVSATPEDELYESGIEELDRFAEWMTANAERQNWEAEL